jgi:prenyl protein peptidase
MLAIYDLSGTPRTRMIFLTPLSFGLGPFLLCWCNVNACNFRIAHVHHAWETFNKYGRDTGAAKRAVLSSGLSHFAAHFFVSQHPPTVVQLLYTTLFGTYCAYLFLRTGSIFPPISAHAFCNVMGLPELRLEMRMFPSKKYCKSYYCAVLS